jgi:hypothetical protein
MTTVKESGELSVDNPILHPPDTADATVFPGNVSQGELLPPFGYRVWLAGGRQTIDKEEVRRSARTWRNDTVHSFWPLVQGPIFTYKHTTFEMDFGGVMPAAAQGLTLSFWYQQLEVNRSDDLWVHLFSAPCRSCAVWDSDGPFGPSEEIGTNPDCPNDCFELSARTLGFWTDVRIKQVHLHFLFP